MTVEFCEWKDGGEVAAAADAASVTLALDTGSELGPDSYQPSDRDTIAYIRDEQGIVSLAVICKWNGSCFIGLAWTRPDARRRGYYRAVVAAVTNYAKRAGLSGISLGVCADNALSLAVHDALGLKRRSIFYETKFCEGVNL